MRIRRTPTSPHTATSPQLRNVSLGEERLRRFPNPYSTVFFYECDECGTKWGWRVRRAGGFSNGGTWERLTDDDGDEDPKNPNLAPHSN